MEAVGAVEVGQGFSSASGFSHMHLIGASAFRKGRYVHLDVCYQVQIRRVQYPEFLLDTGITRRRTVHNEGRYVRNSSHGLNVCGTISAMILEFSNARLEYL